MSEERGWELLWLACGSFACSAILLKEINAFLRTKGSGGRSYTVPQPFKLSYSTQQARREERDAALRAEVAAA